MGLAGGGLLEVGDKWWVVGVRMDARAVVVRFEVHAFALATHWRRGEEAVLTVRPG